MDNTEKKNRRYCFTIPNYTKKNLVEFSAIAESLDRHRYICYGLEISKETGLKHIQGYVEFNEAQRFLHLHSYILLEKRGKQIKFHIETAKGTADQNKTYCSKDGDFYEFGEPSFQGKRTDMIEIKNLVRENPKEVNQIIDEYCDNPQQLQYAQRLQPIYLPPRDPNNPPQVYWISGKSGVGKTSMVYKIFNDICSVSSYKWLGTNYTQNECFLMDDFRPECIPFEVLLRVTDRYPTNLEYKGSFVQLNSPFIVITSPDPIDETFEFLNEDLTQLHRRITEICLDNHDDIESIDLRNLDKKYIYPPVNNDDSDF